VDLAETHFGGKWNIPGSDLPVPAHEASKYTGGEIYVEKPDLPLLNMSIAFEGVSVGDPDLFAIATLNMMMGGGGSFSVGGPGKVSAFFGGGKKKFIFSHVLFECRACTRASTHECSTYTTASSLPSASLPATLTRACS